MKLAVLRESIEQLQEAVDQRRQWLRDVFRSRRATNTPPPSSREFKNNGDVSFALALEADAILQAMASRPLHSPLRDLKRRAAVLRDRAQRYNRAQLGYLVQGPVAWTALDHYRNFRREGREQMTFVALHGLPSAYDLFCCTCVATPKGFEQEVHLHHDSAELTLVYEGQTDCVWYEPGLCPGEALRRAGTISAGPLQAFRIPPRTAHTISNPAGPNKNLTIKLSMFVNDRIGRNDWRFPHQTLSSEPVAVDSGDIASTPWGRTVRFVHGHRNLRFGYRVDEVRPRRRMDSPAGSERRFFLLTGKARIVSRSAAPQFFAAPGVLRFDPLAGVAIENVGREPMRLFSLEGLSASDALAQEQARRMYPTWLIQEIEEDLA